MTRLFTLILATLIIMLFCCPISFAAQDDDSDMHMRIPEVRLVNVDPNSIDFEPDLTDMVDGWTKIQEVTATVSANTNWVLMVQGSSDFWEGPYQKPISDIWWNLAGGEYSSLTTSSVPVVSSGKCNRSGYPIHIKIALDLAKDEPGEYHYYNIVFTLTAP
jgi:hypothetical protein